MTETLIKEYMPARWRKSIYAAYAIVGVLIGAIQVGFAAADIGQPGWLTVALAVYAFVGGAIGLTAKSHTPKPEEVASTQ
jgi:protein-S-isoprenylcysteine O-methyltransferase Ste14